MGDRAPSRRCVDESGREVRKGSLRLAVGTTGVQAPQSATRARCTRNFLDHWATAATIH